MAKRKPKKPPAAKRSPPQRGSDRAPPTEESFERSLRDHKQLHEGPGPLRPGETHVLKRKKTPKGTTVTIERKRFSIL